jgi:hypothetical protein
MLSSIVLLAVFAVGSPRPGWTTLDLVMQCHGAVVEHATAQQAADGAHCMGYLTGIADAHTILAGVEPRARMWCEPTEGVEAMQRLRLLLRFIETRPEASRESARSQVMIAHMHAFPCPITPPLTAP